jgi:hypothetical protein
MQSSKRICSQRLRRIATDWSPKALLSEKFRGFFRFCRYTAPKNANG